jgi:hypothetical protein
MIPFGSQKATKIAQWITTKMGPAEAAHNGEKEKCNLSQQDYGLKEGARMRPTKFSLNKRGDLCVGLWNLFLKNIFISTRREKKKFRNTVKWMWSNYNSKLYRLKSTITKHEQG